MAHWGFPHDAIFLQVEGALAGDPDSPNPDATRGQHRLQLRWPPAPAMPAGFHIWASLG